MVCWVLGVGSCGTWRQPGVNSYLAGQGMLQAWAVKTPLNGQQRQACQAVALCWQGCRPEGQVLSGGVQVRCTLYEA